MSPNRGKMKHVLVRIRHLVLYSALVIDTPAVGASALLAMGLDIVVAELTDLSRWDIVSD